VGFRRQANEHLQLDRHDKQEVGPSQFGQDVEGLERSLDLIIRSSISKVRRGKDRVQLTKSQKLIGRAVINLTTCILRHRSI
jgi:hypothetical protein